MKPLLAYVAFVAIAAFAFGQAPPISQLFAFYCTPNYESCPNGFQPGPGPIPLANGNLYGATAYGTTGNGGGTVWQANLVGDVNALYNFAPNGSGQYPNGEIPSIGLVPGIDGNLYGVTGLGGANDAGVFYSLTTGGTQQVLYSFCSLPGCPDLPLPVVPGADGNFYGITAEFVFQITPEGVWRKFYNFNLPSAEGNVLIAGTDGNLYGAAFIDLGPKFKGVVFRLTTGGVYTVVHTFGKQEGAGVLTQSSNGTIYGVFTGLKSGIFQIDATGKYKLVQKVTDPAYAPTLLVAGSDGNLYGLINNTQKENYPGVVFAINSKRKTIFSEELNCETVGCDPESLIEGTDGNFYGLTPIGGTVAPGDIQNGTIFKVATGLKER
ncbi:MAG TPA: choice-of-anchor tandem repeat GloVer-containing protein [Candidatus Acidoferrum sp.]|nr:choice-of-anchor tandem repeat GloVer-containing protein [Candidatus Acidoferrum sp.]